MTSATEDTAPVHDDTSSIGRRAGRGLRWSLLGTITFKVASFGMALVLARLLGPSDFGVFAIALAVQQIAMHVNDLGLIAGTVQWRGKLEEMAPTASTVAFSFSVFLYVIIWFTAPAFAALSGSPDAAPLVRLLTVTIIIDGVTAVRAAALMRNFQQDKLTKAIMAGFAVNCALTVSLAVGGAGPYSFVGGQVTGALVTGILVFVWARIPVRVGLDRAIAKKLLRFGIPLAMSLGAEALLLSGHFAIVGNVMGAVALGYYLLAFNISSWAPGIVTTAIRNVSIAGFSRLSEGRPERLSAGVQRSVPLLVTALAPIAVLLAVLAPQVVNVLFGAEWAPAGPVLRFLMILAVVRILTSLALDILTGAGATRAALWVNGAWAVASLPALLVGTRIGGIQGAAIAHAVVGVFVATPLAVIALHRAGVHLAPIGPMLVRPVAASALAGAVAALVARLTEPHPIIEMLSAGMAGLAVYVAFGVSPRQLRQWAGALRPKRAAVVE